MIIVLRFALSFCHCRILSLTWMSFVERIKHFNVRERKTKKEEKEKTWTTGNWTTEVFNGCDSRDEISIRLLHSLRCHYMKDALYGYCSLVFGRVFKLPLQISLVNPLLSLHCWRKLASSILTYVTLIVLVFLMHLNACLPHLIGKYYFTNWFQEHWTHSEIPNFVLRSDKFQFIQMVLNCCLKRLHLLDTMLDYNEFIVWIFFSSISSRFQVINFHNEIINKNPIWFPKYRKIFLESMHVDMYSLTFQTKNVIISFNELDAKCQELNCHEWIFTQIWNSW